MQDIFDNDDREAFGYEDEIDPALVDAFCILVVEKGVSGDEGVNLSLKPIAKWPDVVKSGF